MKSGYVQVKYETTQFSKLFKISYQVSLKKLITIRCFHIINYSICAPTFTSSDWSTHVLIISYVTKVMWYALEDYASEGKTQPKTWGTNWLINTLFYINS